jgi:hypothetical protein
LSADRRKHGWPSLMPEFLAACTITGEVCGNPSPELRKALQACGVTI